MKRPKPIAPIIAVASHDNVLIWCEEQLKDWVRSESSHFGKLSEVTGQRWNFLLEVSAGYKAEKVAKYLRAGPGGGNQ